MRVSLHTADLQYGGGLVLHTASSGSVLHLSELYLRLDDGKVIGIGEVRANIAYLNGLTQDFVLADAVSAIERVDWSHDPARLLDSMSDWAEVCSIPVRTLIDCALHDLLARRAGRSVAASLGGTHEGRVVSKTNQTLFWSSHDSFLARSQAYVDRGFRDLKVRVAARDFSEDLRRIAALRTRFGDSVRIAADANGRWGEAEALNNLRALAEFGLTYVEQPIPPGDWSMIERLAKASPIAIMLDESVGSTADIERICALEGNVFAHLKLVKLGGIAPTIAAARRLSEAGIPFMIGQMNEGAAATAAALHVACASSAGFQELYGADGLIDDPVAGITYGHGTVIADAGPGLGVTFDATKARLILER